MPGKKSKDKFRRIPSWDKSRERQPVQSQNVSEDCSPSAILERPVPEVNSNLQPNVEESLPPTASEKKIMDSVESSRSDLVEGQALTIIKKANSC